MRVIRGGTVGGGVTARTCSFALAAVHGLAWPDVPPVERVRLADVAPGQGGRTARPARGWAEITRDWRAVTRAGDADLVPVPTPDDSHAEIGLDALARGEHVLCERPLARTLEAVRAMYREAVAGGAAHQVGFAYPETPAPPLAPPPVPPGRAP